MISYILRSSCYFEIWALCVTWITFDHYYYAFCFACWAIFGSLVPAMWNRTSCVQVHEFRQSYCGDNREGTLFPWLRIYYAQFASVIFEYSVCSGSVLTTNITLLAMLVGHFLLHWYQQCRTAPMCPSDELPQSHCDDNWEVTLFSWLHIYYAQLASVRF